jgi:hypothetical protein
MDSIRRFAVKIYSTNNKFGHIPANIESKAMRDLSLLIICRIIIIVLQGLMFAFTFG